MSHFKTKKIQTTNTSASFSHKAKNVQSKNGLSKKKSPKMIRKIVSFLLVVTLIVF